MENTVGKGEIAHHKQFLFFSQFCQKTCTAESKNQDLLGKRLTDHKNLLNTLLHCLPNDKTLDWFKLKTSVDDKLNGVQIMTFAFAHTVKLVSLKMKGIDGNGGNAGCQHFILSNISLKIPLS